MRQYQQTIDGPPPRITTQDPRTIRRCSRGVVSQRKEVFSPRRTNKRSSSKFKSYLDCGMHVLVHAAAAAALLDQLQPTPRLITAHHTLVLLQPPRSESQFLSHLAWNSGRSMVAPRVPSSSCRVCFESGRNTRPAADILTVHMHCSPNPLHTSPRCSPVHPTLTHVLTRNPRFFRPRPRSDSPTHARVASLGNSTSFYICHFPIQPLVHPPLAHLHVERSRWSCPFVSNRHSI